MTPIPCILLIPLYDTVAIGARILSAVLKDQGLVRPIILSFKRETSNRPIFYTPPGNTYTFFHLGTLRDSILAANPPTRKEEEIFVDLLRCLSPRAICFSTRSFGADLARRLAELARHALPGVPVIIGGWGPTVEPERFLSFCDAVAFGEGEGTIQDLGRLLSAGGSLNDVRNIICRLDDGTLKRGDICAPLTPEDMDALPFPDYAPADKYLIDANKLFKGSEIFSGALYDCFVGRGCAMSCSYCMSHMQATLYRKAGHHMRRTRMRSPAVVLREISVAKQNGARFVRFCDEVFPHTPEWIDAFCDRYRTEIGLPFWAYVRPEFHSQATIERLAQAGLAMTAIGIQSGSDRILRDVYKRNLKGEDGLRLAHHLRRLGISFSYHMINHNPFETVDDLGLSLDLCFRLPYANMDVNRLAVFPESKLESIIRKEQPVPLSSTLHDWYAVLFSMATIGPFRRKLAKIIYRLGFLRKFPYPLQAIFLVDLAKETAYRFLGKRKYNVVRHKISNFPVTSKE